MEEHKNEEQNFRINIKQNTKNICYWDITVRGNNETQIKKRLEEAIQIAQKKCKQLN